MDPIYSTQAALANAALLTVVPVTKTTHATTTVQHAATEAVAAVEIAEDTMPVSEPVATAVEIAEPVVTAPKKTSKKTTKKKTTSTEA